MCGRFFVNDDAAREMEKLLRTLEEKLWLSGSAEEGDGKTEGIDFSAFLKTGDIHPTEYAAVISAEQKKLVVTSKKWGFPGFESSNARSPKAIINARAETVLEKKIFRDSVLNRRIVIPAAGFYEWNKNKEKVTFTACNMHSDPGGDMRSSCVGASTGENAPVLYMAGFYNYMAGADRFVILTAAANESMKETHDRMPLILEPEEVGEWLLRQDCPQRLLHKVPGRLQKNAEYEQQCLRFE